MRAVADGWSIVIRGHWNAHIFRPEWMTGRLTESQDFVIELPVGYPTQPPRFSFDGIHLRITDYKFVVHPQQIEDAAVNRMCEIATATLNALPHTPVSAIGVNFQYVEDSPSTELAGTFQIPDAARISDVGATVATTLISRQLTVDGLTCNLKLTFDSADNVVFDFNFHRDTPEGASAAIEFLNHGVDGYRDVALQFLENVYQLIPETE